MSSAGNFPFPIHVESATLKGVNQGEMIWERSDASSPNDWIKFGMRLFVTSALHPLEYAKVLIQIGYEPIPARAGKTLFGQPALILPNIFQYTNYIRKIDGLSGCYRGLGPKLLGTIVGSIGSEKITKALGFHELPNDDDDEDVDYEKFERNLHRDIVLHASALALTQPFHVISVRMMAQFVGKETLYSSFWVSVKEIRSQEGLGGFFSGFTAKLVCDISCLILSSTTIYLIKKHLVQNKESRQYINSIVNYLYSTLMYPMNVVSTCLAVSGSRLKAGTPPHMPIYKGWSMCLRDLYVSGDHKRGSSLFWRCQKPMATLKINVPFPALK